MIDATGLVGEGERGSSMLSTTGQAAGAGPLAPGQRWSLARKHEVVLRLLRGEPVEAVSRQFGVPVWQLERWRARALAGLKTGLRERSEDPAERELAEAHRRIGELSMEVVVEHWNAEVLGWHVAEKANRFAAARALDLAIHTACGAVRADAARGLLLRHDHGSAFMSDHFQN